MQQMMNMWKQLNFAGKTAYLLTGLLFVLIPFEGLVLESVNLPIPGIYTIVSTLYWAAILFAAISKQWKLLAVAALGTWLLWAWTIGLAEVLWYYLNTWFGIDISYR